MLTISEWVENSHLAVAIRKSLWLYPALEVIHILGIVLLVGAALMFDFRLLGRSKNIPVQSLANHLLPWSRGGLWLILPSGILLFLTNATALSENPTFWLKMGLLLLAAINVIFFHQYIFNSQRTKERNLNSAKISAIISIIVWTSIIACGRWLAY